MRNLWPLMLLLVLCAACSDSGNDRSVAIDVPEEVFRAIPSGAAVARTADSDFDHDGRDDFVLSYGPTLAYRNTQFGVLAKVGTRVTQFSRSSEHELEFETSDVNGDGISDLTIRWPADGLVCEYYFVRGSWVVLDESSAYDSPCQGAQIQP